MFKTCLTALAAALTLGLAAPALAAVIFFLNRGPGYHVVDPPAGVSVVVNGETIPVDDGQAMARALKPGARIAFEGGAMMVNLVSPEHLFVQLTPGSETVLPKTPGRWFGRSARSEVTRGEVRYATGRRFRGAGMTVYTQDTRVDLVGTTLAVIQNDFGTCICLFEGAVWMGPRGGTMEILPAERRRTLYKDGRPALTEELPPDERMKLGMLRGIMDESASGKD